MYVIYAVYLQLIQCCMSIISQKTEEKNVSQSWDKQQTGENICNILHETLDYIKNSYKSIRKRQNSQKNGPRTWRKFTVKENINGS